MLSERDRALSLLQRHGWATVSFQLLASELSYWFDGDDAFVGYVDTGGAWVAGGDMLGFAAASIARRQGLVIVLVMVTVLITAWFVA